MPQKKSLQITLACSSCFMFNDTNRSMSGLTVSKFQAALYCENSTGHQKVLLDLILSLLKDKKR